MQKYDVKEDFKALPIQSHEFYRGAEFNRQLAIAIATKGAGEYLEITFRQPDLKTQQARIDTQLKRMHEDAELKVQLQELKRAHRADEHSETLQQQIKECQDKIDDNAWDNNDQQRLSHLQAAFKSSKTTRDKMNKSTAEVVEWISDRVDAKLMRVVTNIQIQHKDNTPKQMQEIVKKMKDKLAGNETTMKNDMRMQLEKIKDAKTAAQVRDRLSTMEHIKATMEEHIRLYGGTMPVTDEEFIRRLKSIISIHAQKLVVLRTTLGMQSQEATWDQIAQATTRFLDQEQINGKDNDNDEDSGKNKPNKQEVYNADKVEQPKSNTKRSCNLWTGKVGSCRFGNSCHFSHEENKDNTHKMHRERTRSQSPGADRKDKGSTSPLKKIKHEDTDKSDSESDNSVASKASVKIKKGTLRKY